MPDGVGGTGGGGGSGSDAAAPPFRLAAGLTSLPASLELRTSWRLVPAFPDIGFDDPVSLQEVPGTGYLAVSEREGRLYAFERRAGVRDKRLMLDLSAYNQGEDDAGLLGVAFHPQFAEPTSANRGYVYVHYAFRDMPIVGMPPPVTTRTRSRLARFTVNLDTLVADPASELVLIDQDDQNIWHQGGGLFFHPRDGFLYLSVGDEGSAYCLLDNCQRIDKDLFSGVLRIDVDQIGGNVSHPIGRQPLSGATANYFIPNDNPFVGGAGVLEEFYALGLRNPYRMTYDPVDDVVWIGEVGQEGREELNVLAPGANFQWNVFEGTLRSRGADPAVRLGVWTAPALELDRRQALSIIGGYVYRGQLLPDLVGKYIFADFTRGRIWALDYDVEAGQVTVGDMDLLMTAEFRERVNGITSFGVDADGELYFLTLGANSKIQRLETIGTELNAPVVLSDVGIFQDLEALTPRDGFVDYTVQSPLWSDGADKQRWLALPHGEAVGFTETGPWSFPDGTVFVKHFAMALDEREPARQTRLETRVLVAGAAGKYYGLTYKWNTEQTDAILVEDDTLDRLDVITADGGQRTQSYFYPGPNDCVTCHNPEAGYVLGVRTAQLNGPLVAPAPGGTGQATEQLALWALRGMFDEPPDLANLGRYSRLTPLSNETASLEDRVRSYWDANCSMCHGVRTNIRAEWDARYETPLAQQGVVGGVALNPAEDGATLLVEPGNAAQSILYQRSATLGGRRMPPLGTHRLDEQYLDVLQRWIEALP